MAKKAETQNMAGNAGNKGAKQDQAAAADPPQDKQQLSPQSNGDATDDARGDPEGTRDRLPKGGNGPGGRQLVLTDPAAGPRKVRIGDENLPQCPRCTTDEVAVLCVVASTQGVVRWYYCPNRCGFSVKQIPSQLTDAMRMAQDGPIKRPFVERPLG